LNERLEEGEVGGGGGDYFLEEGLGVHDGLIRGEG